MKKNSPSQDELELQVELLKERIYATLALLAVLLTIDAARTSALRATFVIAGTALSLWAASLIASRMSYRIVMQQMETGEKSEAQLVRHSPLLLAAVFPLLMTSFSVAHLISLSLAINIAIGASLLLIVIWSLLSAIAMRMGQLFTLVVALAELAIGIGIVLLKFFLGH